MKGEWKRIGIYKNRVLIYNGIQYKCFSHADGYKNLDELKKYIDSMGDKHEDDSFRKEKTRARGKKS